MKHNISIKWHKNGCTGVGNFIFTDDKAHTIYKRIVRLFYNSHMQKYHFTLIKLILFVYKIRKIKQR